MKTLLLSLILIVFSNMALAITTQEVVDEATAIMDAQRQLLNNFSAEVAQITTEESGGQTKVTEYNLLFYKAKDQKAKTYINKAVRNGKDVTSEERNKGKKDRQQESLSPFDKRYHSDYTYELVEINADGYVIRVNPIKMTSEHMKGRYWIDSEFYLSKAQVHPAKNPQYINDLKTEIEYYRFKGRYLLPKWTRTYVDIAALFFYQGKIWTIQSYDNYQVNLKQMPKKLEE